MRALNQVTIRGPHPKLCFTLHAGKVHCTGLQNSFRRHGKEELAAVTVTTNSECRYKSYSTVQKNYTHLLRFISGREEAIHQVLDTMKANPIMNSSTLGKKYRDMKFYLFSLLVCVSSFRQPLWFYSYPTNETIVTCIMEGYFYNLEAVCAIQSVYI